MIGTECCQWAGRITENGCRLRIPHTLTIRPGAYIKCVFEYRRNRAVILRRNEDNTVDRVYFFSKRMVRSGCIAVIIKILVVQSEFSNFNNLKLETFRRHVKYGTG